MQDLLAVLKDKVPPAGDFPPCFAFSIHKAGSTLMHKMIGETCVAAHIPAISIPDLLFREGVKAVAWQNDPSLVDLVGPGRVYFGFRQLPGFLLDPRVRLREHRSVLLVRDPRDALVSEYYSFSGKSASHRLPDKNQDAFLKQAEATASLDIDEYVLKFAGAHLRKLQAYREHLDAGTTLLRRYEDIYFDKRTILGEIFAHFRLSPDAAILDQVAAANDVRPAAEDQRKHIRKGAPGDHRDKLRPETIAALDALFRDTCRHFGYELGG
jgi:hypothetical protein